MTADNATLVRDLTDDDGEDSYTAFQEYLGRVGHEINEVFEDRRVRQRAQQMQASDRHAVQLDTTVSNDAAVINIYQSSDNRLSQCDVVDAPYDKYRQ